MEDLGSWWNSLEPIFKVFWGVSLTSSMMFLVMFLLSFLGSDGDAGADMHDGDMNLDGADGGFMGFVLSFKTIMAFILGASWTGLTALYQGWALPIVILVSIVAGIILMGATAGVLYSFLKLQEDSTLTMDKTIGCTGNVYLSIQPDMKSGGQVEILVNNSYKTFRAVCNDPEPIKANEKIVVLDVLDDNVLLVGRMSMPLDGGDIDASKILD